jgi:hypothetical protein
MICSIRNCDEPAKTRGWCNRHYLKWWRYGKPEAGRTFAKRGSGGKHSGGYRTVCIDGEQRLEHVVIAERALGRPLPPGAVVHHFNEIKSDNRNRNLIVCQDEAFHKLLHRRQRAFNACGHVDWVRCRFCGEWWPRKTMQVYERQGQGVVAYHQACRQKSRLEKRKHQ